MYLLKLLVYSIAITPGRGLTLIPLCHLIDLVLLWGFKVRLKAGVVGMFSV